MRPGKPFFFNSSRVLIFAAIIIIFLGLAVMLLGLQPRSSGESASEFRLGDESYACWEFPGFAFNENVKGELVHHSATGPEENVSLYVLIEDDYQEFLEWLAKNPNGSPASKLDSLEHSYLKNETGNFSFTFNTDREGDHYLVVMSNGGTQHFTVTVKHSSRVESGVCFSVCSVLGIIGVLLFKAASHVGRPRDQEGMNHNYSQGPPWRR